ncbi:MAG: hypothetical protein HQK83_14000 [Fibrobacteria bacterium]|nr:hypothetical protein [Fibrobacteria bacterium]
MKRFFSIHPMSAIILTLLILADFSQAKPPAKPSTRHNGTIAILNLVDLHTNTPKQNLSRRLRKVFSGLRFWDIMAVDDMSKKLAKYNKSLDLPCNDAQCGFEIGGLLQTKYVLLGTVTRYQELGLLTLKLLNLETAKIVWSKATTSRGETEELEANFVSIRNEFVSFKRTPPNQLPPKKTLALVDFSPTSLLAKVLFERVLTHAYALDNFEIMSPVEVGELISVLEVDNTSLLENPHNAWDIGKKLGVSYVLYTEFEIKGVNFKHNMSLHDIENKSIPISMPALPNANFRDMMIMENNFFKTLSVLELDNQK